MARDYYSVLVRAVSALDPNTRELREAVYDRARHALADFGPEAGKALDEQVALEAAIRRVESELAAGRRPAVPQGPGVSPSPSAVPAPADDAAAPAPDAPPRSFLRRKEVLVGVALLIVGIVGYAFWPRSAIDPGKVQAVAPRPAVDDPQRPAGGKLDANRDSWVFNRQLVFYRTVHPAGTIVIAKSQGFLYLVRPNGAALRYTIEVGRQCASMGGLLLVSAKEDWTAPPRGSEARSAGQNTALPDRQFGARSLALADTGRRIQGTDGQSGPSSCFVLVNDDVIDLYDRVAIGARVVMN